MKHASVSISRSKPSSLTTFRVAASWAASPPRATPRTRGPPPPHSQTLETSPLPLPPGWAVAASDSALGNHTCAAHAIKVSTNALHDLTFALCRAVRQRGGDSLPVDAQPAEVGVDRLAPHLYLLPLPRQGLPSLLVSTLAQVHRLRRHQEWHAWELEDERPAPRTPAHARPSLRTTDRRNAGWRRLTQPRSRSAAAPAASPSPPAPPLHHHHRPPCPPPARAQSPAR